MRNYRIIFEKLNYECIIKHMKIFPNAEQRVLYYVDNNNLSMSLSDMFSLLVGNSQITNKEEVEALKKKFNLSSREVLLNKYREYLEIDPENEEDELIYHHYFEWSIYESDINKYLNNPYYQRMKLLNIKDGDYELVTDTYKAYELFPYKDMDEEVDTFIEANSFSFFEKDFKFLALNYKGVTWMSITPNEIETMEEAVKAATGKVIVYGLGLGYYPYMISLKDEVKEIVIVENDIKIINLFKKHILPNFEHQEKISIIHGDAFEYMGKCDDFDYAFIDLWHDTFDGLELFLRAKKLEKQGKKYFYWLESSFYLLLRRCFISLMEEQLAHADESNYKKSKNITDKVINTYYEKTKSLVIRDSTDFETLLSSYNLLNLLLK